MYFDTVQAALQMDGHGGFVWAAYAATFLVVLCLLLVPVRRSRRLLRQLSGELRRTQGATTQQGHGRV